MDLATLFPQPIPVRLGGRLVLARALRIRQLAELQGWIRAAVPDPSGVLEGLERLEGEGRRRALVGAYLAAEAWPPRVGTAEADALLDSPDGRTVFLAAALVDFNPELTAADLREMAAAEDPAGWGRLMAACYELGPLERIARAIERPAPSDASPAELSELVAGLVVDQGWTLAEVGELTLGQVSAIYTRGKGREPDYPPRPGETLAQACERRRAYFAIDDEGATDGDG